jgi:hypothetical protein
MVKMMSKELRDGREFFDGEPVDIYEGRFVGPFIMDENSGATMSNGDLVTFIVTARVDTPKFAYVKKSNDLKRSNSMKVTSVVAIDGDKAKYLYDSIGENVDGINEGIIEIPSIEVAETSIDDLVEQDSLFNKEMTV